MLLVPRMKALLLIAALNVVEPMMSGIGGYWAFIIYDAKEGETKYLDGSGRIPAAADAMCFPSGGNWPAAVRS